ncbi:MAG: phytanoyl-CoA dioxygenase family protein [Comamonas sp.]
MDTAPIDHTQLQRDGYALLRQAIPLHWLDGLRNAFDTNVMPSHAWPVPRDQSWRFSMLDLDVQIQAVCRLPPLLAAVGALIGESFFLSQVEGREPLPGYGHQRLHRDMMLRRPGDTVHVMAFFDDYSPANGATRIVPGTHRPTLASTPFDLDDESQTVLLAGKAGDLLVFDSDLVHAASQNQSGARRRSLLFCYFAASLYGEHLKTASLRNVRMDTSSRFSPTGVLVT